MIELHLIGYTEDGDHLVLDLDADGEGRYVVAIDPDLLATVEVAREERLARGKPVDERRPAEPAPPPRVEPAAPANGHGPDGVATPPPAEAASHEPGPAVPSSDRPGTGVPAAAEEPPTPVEVDLDAVEAPIPTVRSRLSPAEIQARLRAGRTVPAVAREAGVDRAWVERWNEPIRAERERVLADAWTRRIDVPRAQPLGVAVDRSLSERRVDPATASWRVVRRDDGRWRVSVRFEERGRMRTATWLLDPGEECLRAKSRLATELSAPGRRTSRR